jgi:hypothetical protein
VYAAEMKRDGIIVPACYQAAVYVNTVTIFTALVAMRFNLSYMGHMIQVAMVIAYRLLKFFVGPRKAKTLATEFIKASTITAFFAAVTSHITSFF